MSKCIVNKSIKVKPFINKSNNQVSLYLPRSKLPKNFMSRLPMMKSVKLRIEEFDEL